MGTRLKNHDLDVRDGVHHVLHDLRDRRDRRDQDLVASVFRELSGCGNDLDLFLAPSRCSRN